MRSSALPVPVPQTPTAVPDNLPEGYAPIMPTDPTSVESVEAAKAAALAGNPQYETRTYSDGSTVTGRGPLPELSPEQQDAKNKSTL